MANCRWYDRDPGPKGTRFEVGSVIRSFSFPLGTSMRRNPAPLVRWFICGAIVLDVAFGCAAASRGAVSSLATGALLAILAVVGCLASPRGVLYLIAALWGATHFLLSDFSVGSVGGVTLTLSRALGLLLLFGLGLGAFGLAAKTQQILPRAIRLLVLFAVLYGFDAVISSDTTDGLSDLIRVASAVAIGVTAFYTVDTGSRLLRLAGFVTAGGVVVAGVTLAQFALLKIDPGLGVRLFGPSFYLQSYDFTSSSVALRVNGPLSSPDETGAFLVVAAGFAMLRLAVLRASRIPRRESLALSLIGAAIAVTFTRAALAAACVLALVWLAQRRRTGLRSLAGARARAIALAAITAVVAAQLLSPSTLQARIWDVNPFSTGANFAQGRGAIWHTEIATIGAGNALEVFVGHGAHASYVAVTDVHGDTSVKSPHNLVLWLLVETGLAGFVIYAGFLLSLLRSYAGAYRHGDDAQKNVAIVCLAFTAAYFVLDMFLLTVNSPGNRWYYMLFAGATLRFLSTASNESGIGIG